MSNLSACGSVVKQYFKSKIGKDKTDSTLFYTPLLVFHKIIAWFIAMISLQMEKNYGNARLGPPSIVPQFDLSKVRVVS